MLQNNLPPPTVSPRLPVIRPRIWGGPCGLIASQLKGGWDQSRSGWRTSLLGENNVFRTFKKNVILIRLTVSSFVITNKPVLVYGSSLFSRFLLAALRSEGAVWSILGSSSRDKGIVDWKGRTLRNPEKPGMTSWFLQTSPFWVWFLRAMVRIAPFSQGFVGLKEMIYTKHLVSYLAPRRYYLDVRDFDFLSFFLFFLSSL